MQNLAESRSSLLTKSLQMLSRIAPGRVVAAPRSCVRAGRGTGARTLVVVVPAARVELADGRRGLVGAEQAVHRVQLAPRERVTEHLARLLQVEVARAQEAQHVHVLRHLGAAVTTVMRTDGTPVSKDIIIDQ